MPSPTVERAAFATISRLLSCLITESLVRAIFIPLKWSDCVGIGIVLKPPTSTVPGQNSRTCSQGDVLSIILLRYVPIFKPGSSDPRGNEIGLLDPLDMFPLMLVTSLDGDSGENEVRILSFYAVWFVYRSGSLRQQLHHSDLLSAVQRVFSMPGWSFPGPTVIKAMNDPLILWDQFATSIDLDPAMRSDISDELASSVRWQAYSYDHPPSAPTPLSPSIDWEQSIVEGHPTHPVRVLSVLTRR